MIFIMSVCLTKNIKFNEIMFYLLIFKEIKVFNMYNNI